MTRYIVWPCTLSSYYHPRTDEIERYSSNSSFYIEAPDPITAANMGASEKAKKLDYVCSEMHVFVKKDGESFWTEYWLHRTGPLEVYKDGGVVNQ